MPQIVRHSLNLESGLNDGLALPAVLAFGAALATSGSGFVWWRFVLEDLVIGFGIGLIVGFVAARLMPLDTGLGESIPAHQKSLYALGCAFAAYGIAVLIPHGNGLIAVYVAAIVLGIQRPDVRAYFEKQAADLVEIVKLGVFVVFGSLLTVHGLFGSGWAAVGVVAVALLVARPIAVFAALVGTETDMATRAFMFVVRPQGSGHHDLLAAGPQPVDCRRLGHIQPGRAHRVLVNPGPRGDRHRRGRVDRLPRRAGRQNGAADFDFAAGRDCVSAPAGLRDRSGVQ